MHIAVLQDKVTKHTAHLVIELLPSVYVHVCVYVNAHINVCYLYVCYLCVYTCGSQ